MSHSLLNIFHDDKSKVQSKDPRTLINNIQSHLTQLLNSRRGSLRHLSDYGLPELSSIHQFSNETLTKFIYAIKETIEKYETRLTNIHISHTQENQSDCILRLQIEGEIQTGEVIHFESDWLPTGEKPYVRILPV
ncbi:MAG: type VI secretion system baseplate subunit TssE [Proteobacteria bacterium]|nr:type VI secretion system baseplate subunit TssE [Pseudomonadota bacterium]